MRRKQARSPSAKKVSFCGGSRLAQRARRRYHSAAEAGSLSERNEDNKVSLPLLLLLPLLFCGRSGQARGLEGARAKRARRGSAARAKRGGTGARGHMCERAHVRTSTCARGHMCDRRRRGGSGGLPPTTSLRPASPQPGIFFELASLARRPQGGLGGSTPDNNFACPLLPQPGENWRI
jgi:hypothetical protein